MSAFPAERLENIARLASVDVAGPFERGCVRLRWFNKLRRKTDALESLIEETWTREKALADRSGAVLFNGHLVRYIDHECIDGALCIDVGPTDYKSFLGTNLRNAQLIDVVGRDAFANAIGVSALIICDGEPGTILLGHRSTNVVDQPGTIHTFGGALDESDGDGDIDAFAAVTREISEELALKADDLFTLNCMGLVHDRSIAQPELVFEARVKMSADEVASRVDVSSNVAEHLGVARIDNTPTHVAAYLSDSEKTTPVALTALYLYGWQSFGPTWCDGLLEQLA